MYASASVGGCEGLKVRGCEGARVRGCEGAIFKMKNENKKLRATRNPHRGMRIVGYIGIVYIAGCTWPLHYALYTLVCILLAVLD